MVSCDKHIREMSLNMGDWANRKERKREGRCLEDGSGYSSSLYKGSEEGSWAGEGYVYWKLLRKGCTHGGEGSAG